MNNILFVSAFKDINRNNWNTHSRGIESYINFFLNLAFNLKYNLIVFAKPDIIDLIKKHDIPPNITPENILEAYDYILEAGKYPIK